MIHVIIDGYNLIRQVSALVRRERSSLEEGRENLIQLLAQYKKVKRHSITVVFDGASDLSEFAPTYQQAGIHVSFSPTGSSADEVIRDMVSCEKTRALVVSSDNRVVQNARRQGSSTLSAPEFYDKLVQANLLGFSEKREETLKKEGVHKRWTTKKRGPSRRLSKKERRHQQRAGKL